MPRNAAKKDGNQDELVAILKAYGFSVEKRLARLGEGVPDLLVGGDAPCPHCGMPFPQNFIIEVKQPGHNLRENQEKWHDHWKGQKAVARTQADIERIIGRGGPTIVRHYKSTDDLAKSIVEECWETYLRLKAEGETDAGAARAVSETTGLPGVADTGDTGEAGDA